MNGHHQNKYFDTKTNDWTLKPIVWHYNEYFGTKIMMSHFRVRVACVGQSSGFKGFIPSFRVCYSRVRVSSKGFRCREKYDIYKCAAVTAASPVPTGPGILFWVCPKAAASAAAVAAFFRNISEIVGWLPVAFRASSNSNGPRRGWPAVGWHRRQSRAVATRRPEWFPGPSFVGKGAWGERRRGANA